MTTAAPPDSSVALRSTVPERVQAVVPRSTGPDVRRRIVAALHHDADVDARQVAVEISGGTATLTGTVRTWLERESAERAAASAPGITRVDNHLGVRWVDDPLSEHWAAGFSIE